jgi:hypothetical protein
MTDQYGRTDSYPCPDCLTDDWSKHADSCPSLARYYLSSFAYCETHQSYHDSYHLCPACHPYQPEAPDDWVREHYQDAINQPSRPTRLELFAENSEIVFRMAFKSVLCWFDNVANGFQRIGEKIVSPRKGTTSNGPG